MIRGAVVGVVTLGVALVASCSSNDPGLGGRPGASSGTSGTSGTSGGDPDAGGGGEAGCTKTVCNGACVDTATDAKNCGVCGATCSGGSICGGAVCRCSGTNEICDTPKGGKACDAAGRCHDDALIGTPQFGSGPPIAIAVGSTYAVMSYTAGKLYEIARVDFDGTTKVVTVYAVAPAKLAADGGDYGYSLPLDLATPPKILACAAAACSTTLSGHDGIALQIYNASFFWFGDGFLRRCPLSGCNGTPEDVVALPAGAASRLRIDASGAYGVFGTSVAKWTEASGVWETLFDATSDVRELAIDDTKVYVSTDTSILSCAKVGCAGAADTVTTVAAGQSVRGIAVLGSNVHWATFTPSVGHDLMRCSKTGACVPAKVGVGFGQLLAEDPTHLYFRATAAGNSTRIRRFSK